SVLGDTIAEQEHRTVGGRDEAAQSFQWRATRGSQRLLSDAGPGGRSAGRRRSAEAIRVERRQCTLGGCRDLQAWHFRGRNDRGFNEAGIGSFRQSATVGDSCSGDVRQLAL